MAVALTATRRLALSLLLVLIYLPATLHAAGKPSKAGLEDRIARMVVRSLVNPEPGRDSILTVYDGNFFVQCRESLRLEAWRCETPGELLQPSLHRVLNAKRRAALDALGFQVTDDFGNFVRDVPPTTDPAALAGIILAVLTKGYGATLKDIEINGVTIPERACPPRIGYSQDDAGAITVWERLQSVSSFACSAKDMKAAAPGKPPEYAPATSIPADVVTAYRPAVAQEIGRLRQAKTQKHVFAILDAPTGYVQCAPNPDADTLYCEAVSAEEDPKLRKTLTRERLRLLHGMGFKNPGPVANYYAEFAWTKYSDEQFATMLLTILRDVYGYDGKVVLNVVTATEHRQLVPR